MSRNSIFIKKMLETGISLVIKIILMVLKVVWVLQTATTTLPIKALFQWTWGSYRARNKILVFCILTYFCQLHCFLLLQKIMVHSLMIVRLRLGALQYNAIRYCLGTAIFLATNTNPYVCSYIYINAILSVLEPI